MLSFINKNRSLLLLSLLTIGLFFIPTTKVDAAFQNGCYCEVNREYQLSDGAVPDDFSLPVSELPDDSNFKGKRVFVSKISDINKCVDGTKLEGNDSKGEYIDNLGNCEWIQAGCLCIEEDFEGPLRDGDYKPYPSKTKETCTPQSAEKRGNIEVKLMCRWQDVPADLVGTQGQKEEEAEDQKDLSPGQKELNQTVTTLSGTVYNNLNPLRMTTLSSALGRIIKSIMSIVGTIALAMFMYGGIMWMTASGNSEKQAKAQKVLVWSTLGVVVITGSYAIVKIIFEAIK